MGHLLVFVPDCCYNLIVELIDVEPISFQSFIMLEEHLCVGVAIVEQREARSLLLCHFVSDIELEELRDIGLFSHSVL